MYAIKVELKLNNKEKSLMARHAGFSRMVYNYALALYNQLDHSKYKGGASKKIAAIRKILTNYTKQQPEFAWMNELSSKVYQSALKALLAAFTRFFKGKGEYPKFNRSSVIGHWSLVIGQILSNDQSPITYDHSYRNKQLGNVRKGIRKSKNAGKYYIRLGNRHARIANQRRDFLQKTTTEISRKYSVIRIEDLNVKGMIANHKLSAALSDLGFYEFRRQLVYKQQNYATRVELVDRWFPSSKTCSCCNHVQPMPLSERVFDCQKCGVSIDRDLNAAINLMQASDDKIGRATAESDACGEEGADSPPRNRK